VHAPQVPLVAALLGARQTQLLAERVKQADTRLELERVGYAIDGEADRYRVGSARLQRDRLSCEKG
jgi:hypothetical protein